MAEKTSKNKKVKTPSPTIKEIKFMLYRVRKSPLSLLGTVIIICFAVIAAFAPVLAPARPSWDINRINDPFIIPRAGWRETPTPPSFYHPFGLTSDSFDVYYGCVWGAITAFRVGIYVVALSLVIGLSIGLVAGYYGGVVDEALMRFTDVIIAFPGLILAMAFALALPSLIGFTLKEFMPIIAVVFFAWTLTSFLSVRKIMLRWIALAVITIISFVIVAILYAGIIGNITVLSLYLTRLDKVLVALVLVGWPGYTRVIRGEVLRVRTEDYVEAAKAVGASDLRIIMRHILPNAVYPIVILASLDIGSIVLGAAALSFLGIGADPNFADWGQLVQRSQEYMGTGSSLLSFWYIWVIPGAFIFIFCLGWNLLGDALRDILDPTLRRR